ncbi:hypothetical protein KKA02_02030 [Patescibacteria group bacterium]|nr:hypothetical protein [Patescibacteria group bacterium]
MGLLRPRRNKDTPPFKEKKISAIDELINRTEIFKTGTRDKITTYLLGLAAKATSNDAPAPTKTGISLLQALAQEPATEIEIKLAKKHSWLLRMLRLKAFSTPEHAHLSCFGITSLLVEKSRQGYKPLPLLRSVLDLTDYIKASGKDHAFVVNPTDTLLATLVSSELKTLQSASKIIQQQTEQTEFDFNDPKTYEANVTKFGSLYTLDKDECDPSLLNSLQLTGEKHISVTQINKDSRIDIHFPNINKTVSLTEEEIRKQVEKTKTNTITAIALLIAKKRNESSQPNWDSDQESACLQLVVTNSPKPYLNNKGIAIGQDGTQRTLTIIEDSNNIPVAIEAHACHIAQDSAHLGPSIETTITNAHQALTQALKKQTQKTDKENYLIAPPENLFATTTETEVLEHEFRQKTELDTKSVEALKLASKLIGAPPTAIFEFALQLAILQNGILPSIYNCVKHPEPTNRLSIISGIGPIDKLLQLINTELSDPDTTEEYIRHYATDRRQQISEIQDPQRGTSIYDRLLETVGAIRETINTKIADQVVKTVRAVTHSPGMISWNKQNTEHAPSFDQPAIGHIFQIMSLACNQHSDGSWSISARGVKKAFDFWLENQKGELADNQKQQIFEKILQDTIAFTRLITTQELTQLNKKPIPFKNHQTEKVSIMTSSTPCPIASDHLTLETISNEQSWSQITNWTNQIGITDTNISVQQYQDFDQALQTPRKLSHPQVNAINTLAKAEARNTSPRNIFIDAYKIINKGQVSLPETIALGTEILNNFVPPYSDNPKAYVHHLIAIVTSVPTPS